MNLIPNKDFAEKSQDDKPLILIVDNDLDNLLFASCVVESFGMRCVVTDDSQKCLPLVKELLPDLILLDIVMPEIDGLEITRILKQSKKLANIPIIAVTGLTRPEDLQKIAEVGCDACLAKPYLIEELEARILQFLLR